MSSRLFRIFVLGFTCLWFGMLVPMHQRGQIQLPGSKPTVAEASCMGSDGHCHKKDKPAGKGDEKPAKNPENCAVCNFILGLDAPPPVTVCETRLGLVRDLPVDHTTVIPVRHAALPFHGLDPPTV